MVKKTDKKKLSEEQEERELEKAIVSLDEKLSQKNTSNGPLTFRTIMGGDFLTSGFLRRQLLLIVIITFCMIGYIYNGYSSRKQQIQIARLKTELDDARYNAITRSSELLEKSRQSRVEQYIHEYEDSSIQMATTPPFLIKK